VSRSEPAHPLIESDSVEGITVYGTHVKSVGAIRRLVIEKLSGRVVYAVVGFGGFLGVGQEFYTVPWGKLSFDQDLNDFRTDVDENQLRGAPRSSILGHPDRSDREGETALPALPSAAVLDRNPLTPRRGAGPSL
jgi:PRC-barrel domain